MKGLDEINKITKFHSDILKNINIDTAISSYSNVLKNIDVVKNYNFDTMINNYSNVLKGIDLMKDFNFDIFKGITSDMVVSNFNYDSIKGINFDVLKSIIPDAIRDFNYKAIENIDFENIQGINFASLKNITYDISKTLNDLSEKTELDDNDYEKINDLSNYAVKITHSNNFPSYIRKTILLNFLQKLWKFIGKPQVAVLITIILSCYQIFYVPQKNIIRETIKEIIIIENEHKELNLRGIISNGTKLYKKPNKKSFTVFFLDCGDIVEVLKTNKKWIYIRIFNTDIEGWVFKKYTKGTKNRKADYIKFNMY